MAAVENPKRKRSWSVFSWISDVIRPEKRRRKLTNSEEQLNGNPDLVSLVLNLDIEQLTAKVYPPPEIKDEGDATSRKELVDENPLFVAAKINFPEGARVLLEAGWKIADDRTVRKSDDPLIPAHTPLGVALEKRNDVLALFLKRIESLEKKGLPREKRLSRSWSVSKISASLSVEKLADGEVDLVALVLEDNTELLQKELKNGLNEKPTSNVKGLPYSERLELATDNPLYVAAKIGREKAAEILLGHNWKMTEDLTAGEDEENIPSLTPLGVAYEKQNGVLDIFLNEILSLETAHPVPARKRAVLPVV